MHGCLPFRTTSLVSPPFVARSLLGPCVHSPLQQAAALAAVRYARLADEKNKRRRNVERQKELEDIAEERGRKGSVERRGSEGAKDVANASREE